ncbi:MAG: hypothetical protein WC382_10285 [Methanoregulaceae archaeon]|jgi:hypothetical protein
MNNGFTIKIAEIPSRIWNFSDYFQLPVDRSNLTVAEFLQQRNVIWSFWDDPNVDFRVYKEENIRNGLFSLRRFKNEYQKRFEKIPYLNLNGEAQENSRLAYFLADPERTYSVAPGSKYKRLYFPSLWSDPELDTWEERLDRICWIGRPLPERIKLAKEIMQMGIGLDIYSKEPWPLAGWKGFAEGEIETSRKYRYRIVYENSLKNLYHSEKLFNAIRSGCVTFYVSDPSLALPNLEGAFVRYDEGTLLQREDICQGVMNEIEESLYTDRWEVYSFRHFFQKIIDFAHFSRIQRTDL